MPFPFSMLIKYIPAIITTIAIIWCTLISSASNDDAKTSPKTEDNDNTNTDLTIPILFILIRKKYNDVPKPTAPSTTICGIDATLMFNGTCNTNAARNKKSTTSNN